VLGGKVQNLVLISAIQGAVHVMRRAARTSRVLSETKKTDLHENPHAYFMNETRAMTVIN
jgi:hypothetical protein